VSMRQSPVIGVVLDRPRSLEAVLTCRAICDRLRRLIGGTIRLYASSDEGPFDPVVPIEHIDVLPFSAPVLDALWVEAPCDPPSRAIIGDVPIIWHHAGPPARTSRPDVFECHLPGLAAEGARHVPRDVTRRRLAFLQLLDFVPAQPFHTLDVRAGRLAEALRHVDDDAPEPTVILTERIGGDPHGPPRKAPANTWLVPATISLEDVLAVVRAARSVVTDRPVIDMLVTAEQRRARFAGQTPSSAEADGAVGDWGDIARFVSTCPSRRDAASSRAVADASELAALRRAYEIRGERLVHERLVFTDRLTDLECENARLRSHLGASGASPGD
jgi:hypothetical protein